MSLMSYQTALLCDIKNEINHSWLQRQELNLCKAGYESAGQPLSHFAIMVDFSLTHRIYKPLGIIRLGHTCLLGGFLRDIIYI
jgi:hypothetical protein